jgi:hypothetical protein
MSATPQQQGMSGGGQMGGGFSGGPIVRQMGPTPQQPQTPISVPVWGPNGPPMQQQNPQWGAIGTPAMGGMPPLQRQPAAMSSAPSLPGAQANAGGGGQAPSMQSGTHTK